MIGEGAQRVEIEVVEVCSAHRVRLGFRADRQVPILRDNAVTKERVDVPPQVQPGV